MSGAVAPFADAVLEWFEHAGRKDLPWQRDPTPYRVWVSEVMLQQTQVTVVAGYYERFVERFPDLAALAAGPLDEVLGLWSGLGYYSRARNLHHAACLAVEQHDGSLPENAVALEALPGIGRSTAAAILALALGQRHAILDGNVKRVLARYHAVEGWPGASPVARTLWSLAERHTPGERVAAYTQAIMDLGATVCTRTRPGCGACPLAAGCAANASGTQARYPSPKPRRERPLRRTTFIVALSASGCVLLERRPPSGVWGGLWSFPECEAGADVVGHCERVLGLAARQPRALASVAHGFTHFRLEIEPVLVEVDTSAPGVVADAESRLWLDPRTPPAVGLAAPVARLLSAVADGRLAHGGTGDSAPGR